MTEAEIRALVTDVRCGRLSRRRFVQWMAALGVTVPVAAQMLGPRPTHAQPRPAFTPTRRGGGGQLKVLWWQAPTLLNPHFATGTKDQEAHASSTSRSPGSIPTAMCCPCSQPSRRASTTAAWRATARR